MLRKLTKLPWPTAFHKERQVGVVLCPLLLTAAENAAELEDDLRTKPFAQSPKPSMLPAERSSRHGLQTAVKPGASLPISAEKEADF